MASVKQIEANRNNSKLSTGPKTVEGKLAVRLNALTHGLRTEALDVLPGERESVFENRLHAFNEVYAPRNEVESQLVRRAVVLSWKLERAERHENEVLTQQTFEFINACDCDDDDVPALSRAAALASFDPSPDGERIRRYQFAVERSYFRTLDKLAKVRGQEVHLKPEETTQAAAPIKANSVAPTNAEPVAPTNAEPVAPIKANSAASTKPISDRGRRELARFFSGPGRADAQNITWLDISIDKPKPA